MKGKKILSIALSLTMLPTIGAVMTPAVSAADTAQTTVVRLNPADASPFNNGEFQGWGTSLCWWANRLGYSTSLTEQAAKAFFSEDGLGLDIARYNLGGGDNPEHNHITRSDSKVPGYATGFDEDGNIVYDWTVDENQRNIAKAALAANPDLYVEGFSNSPPYFMTNSLCSSGAENAGSDNLKSDQYGNFAKFIAQTTKHFKEEFGITFESYSPMNEPDTTYWGAMSPKQEGCHFDPGTSQSNMIVETRKALDAEGLTDVLVAGMDETDINKSVSNYASLSAEAKTALGRIDTHTYNGSKRAELKSTAVNAGKDLWMSEVDGGWNGFGLADRIILDMNGMQPAAWVMWDIVDCHKDSNFTTPDGTKSEANTTLNVTGTLWGVAMGNHDTQQLELSNKYYAFGQFTRYINPGDTIIASSNRSLAAYNKKTGDVKIVATNSGSTDLPYTFDLSAFNALGTSVKEIRSNNLTGTNAEHWKEITGEAELKNSKITTTLKAGTITTYVVEGTGEAQYAVINGGTDELNINESVQLSVASDISGDVTWSVSDNNVAEISESGVLTTKNLGTVTVYAKVGGFTTSRDYTVPFKATIGGIGSEIKKGASAQLTLDANITGDVTWSVSDSSIAEISESGVITAKEVGDVTITAAIGEHSVSKTVSVQLYTVSGTPSWGNSSTAPKDSDDYLKATDGNLTTAFDGTTGGWVQYDYGMPFAITSIKLAARSGSGMAERTVGGTVQGSNDGESWTDLYKITSAIPAGSYTTVTSDMLAVNKAYRYFRYTNNDNMANIAEFLIEGEPSDNVPKRDPVVEDIDEFTDNFEKSENIFGAGEGNFTADGNQVYSSSLARFQHVFAPVRATASAALDDAIELTENQTFRMSFNMFAGWESGGKENSFSILDADGNEVIGFLLTGGGYNLNQVRINGTDLLADVSAKPVSQCKSTPSKGANRWGHASQPFVNTMGYNKTVKLMINGDGSAEIAFGGGAEEVSYTGTVSLPVTIKSISLTGNYNSTKDATASYDNFDTDLITYAEPVEEFDNLRYSYEDGKLTVMFGEDMENIKIIPALYDSEGRLLEAYVDTISGEKYDNKVIEYSFNNPTDNMKVMAWKGEMQPVEIVNVKDIVVPEPTAAPTASPVPTQSPAPVLPESGELISLNFDNADLTSTSTYGKAQALGTAVFETVDGRSALKLGGSNATAIKLTDANGNSLLTGQKNLTIAFKVKPTATSTSWWFYAAPNDSAQTYQQEKYIGALGGNGTLTFERYNNSGSRSVSASGAYTVNEWNDVMISIDDGASTIYVNGSIIGTAESTVDISSMLGTSSVAYIGKANWGTGEYATGYIDDFVIYNKPVTNPLAQISIGDTTAVTENITVPVIENVTWETSDAAVVTAAGVVTRADETKTATLTAKTTANGIEFTKDFTVTVLGKAYALETFAAYAENNSIKFTSDYDSTKTPYSISVTLSSVGEDTPIIVDQKDNTASGSFDGLANGKYVIGCKIGEKTVTKTVAVKDELEMGAYLFAHFVGTESSAAEEQIYFSVSTDGTTWKTLNSGAPVLTSTVGEKGVRDPYILRGEDGKFFVIATDLSIYNRRDDSNRWGTCQTSGSKSIVIWESSDIVNWSEASLVKVAPDNAGCTWAPEAVYDAEKDMYMVFWASKTSADNYATQRMYKSYTKDFKTFTEPEIYIDGGNISNIDTTITNYKGVYYRFTKNESKSSVTMMSSTSLSDGWKDVSTYTINGAAGNTVTGYEGPTIYKINGEDKWCLLLDYYSKSQGYKPFVTSDITKGVFTSASDFSMDTKYRHGTVMPITTAEYNALTAAYPTAQ